MGSEFESDGEFTAVDASGKEYVIQKNAEYYVGKTLGGDAVRALVQVELRTDDGRPVNRDDRGVYRIFDREGPTVAVTSDAPNAP